MKRVSDMCLFQGLVLLCLFTHMEFTYYRPFDEILNSGDATLLMNFTPMPERAAE